MKCSKATCYEEATEGLKTCEECRARIRAIKSKWHKSIIDKVYDHYRAVCNCCGLADRSFLSMDHVKNDGYLSKDAKGHRKSGSKLAREIINSNYPDYIQILCYNCNMGKAHNKGICPHKEESNEV